jgi:two-component sensor histidine kinase
VADNGIGFPDAVDFRNTPSLGLQLVNVLAGQIHGTIELSKEEGTTFWITFPKSNS